MRRLFLAAALMLITASAAFAQLGGGTLSGTVTDEQGGILPGVTVTVTGSDRTFTLSSDEAGRFRFLNLPPGQYNSRHAAGLPTVVRENVVVSVGTTTDLPAADEGRDRRRNRHRHRRLADRRRQGDRHGHQLHADELRRSRPRAIRSR